MSTERIYSSRPTLSARRAFVELLVDDLRLTPRAAWPLFVRNLQAQYRQTHLRWAWVLVPSVLTTAVWVYLSHAHLVTVPRTGTTYVVYVLAGTILWQLFLDSLNAPLQKLTAARTALTKSRLPHEAYVLAGLYEAFFNFVVRLGPLIVVMAITRSGVDSTLVFAPLGILALVVLGLSLGVLITPAGLLYQDVTQALTLIAAGWFFLTPVLYPRPAHGIATLLVRVNPVTPLLVTTRAWATAGRGALVAGSLVVVAASLILFLAAWLLYRLARPHLVARL
jgi:lipopolysaccharide transport system permease protein